MSQELLNGVDVERLAETVNAVGVEPSLARFTFRARNKWVMGADNRTSIGDFHGAGSEQPRAKPFLLMCDEPQVLLGRDRAPNPVEFVMHALAGCLTTSLVYHAAARGVRIDEIETTFEGDLDLRGFLGLSKEVRNGYRQLTVAFRIKADAPAETIAELCHLAQARSPVFDIISNPTPIAVRLEHAASATPAPA
jgi:uncharacterized OsmC-like protein